MYFQVPVLMNGGKNVRETSMSFTNITEMIGFWGGIASIFALFAMFFTYARKKLADIQVKHQEQEQKYIQVKSEISDLTSKATTHLKREEVYMYANSLVNYERHYEIRIRIIASVAHIWSFIIVLYAIGMNTFKVMAPGYAINLLKSSLVVCLAALVYFNIKLILSVKHIAKLNDSFAEGFIDVIYEHIKKLDNKE